LGRIAVILLTVGTQLPFDRLVRAVDDIAPRLEVPIIAQIGRGAYRPANMEWRTFVDPIAFQEMFRACDLVVSHAGIGTIVNAQRLLKPLILYPRLASLDEHRNDHQLSTVRALRTRTGLYVADGNERLADLMMQKLEPPSEQSEAPERMRLRESLGAFIEDQFERWKKRY
jgi:UDP-N-acetylglucosamine transferase subunit ALG13